MRLTITLGLMYCFILACAGHCHHAYSDHIDFPSEYDEGHYGGDYPDGDRVLEDYEEDPEHHEEGHCGGDYSDGDRVLEDYEEDPEHHEEGHCGGDYPHGDRVFEDYEEGPEYYEEDREDGLPFDDDPWEDGLDYSEDSFAGPQWEEDEDELFYDSELDWFSPHFDGFHGEPRHSHPHGEFHSHFSPHDSDDCLDFDSDYD
ncbi:hypothetical protein Aperf_G00000124267 [Anoplocephala perfoliata]